MDKCLLNKDGEHCFHFTGAYSYETNEICCWCGSIKQKEKPPHGPHNPDIRYPKIVREVFVELANHPCLHEGLSKDDIHMLSCPCPRCSPRC